MKSSILAFALILFTSGNTFGQAIPKQISYQGVLKDASGNILTGDFSMTFKIYNDLSGGSALWTETQTVSVVNGLFNAQLGILNPITTVPFDRIHFLGVTVGAESELSPRTILSPSPYSFMSINVLDNVITTNKIQNEAITSIKIDSNQVVKSINGLKDDINLVAGTNVTIIPSGNDLTISASAGGGGTIDGSGTTNYLPLFSGATTLGSSVIYQTTDGNIGIGTINPQAKLTLAGSDALINGLTIGKGTNNISSNSAFGYHALLANTTGWHNLALGYNSLSANETGTYNTAAGVYSLQNNTTGSRNTAFGYYSLGNNITGGNNTALGNITLVSNTTGGLNTAVGDGCLWSNVGNSRSTAIGYGAMYYADDRTSGIETFNTAVGFQALYGSNVASNNIGRYNTAVGDQSLYSNTSGSYNTASGLAALFFNTEGENNTANGYWALYHNTTGRNNSATGYVALSVNTTGAYNSAFGSYALRLNTTGSYNTAHGFQALLMNSEGNRNTAGGTYSLSSNTTGDYNTANGDESLSSNTTGSGNTAFGHRTLKLNTTENSNTAVGYEAGDYYTFSTGTFLGASTYPNGSGYANVMGLGYYARPTAGNQVRIGNSSVTSIGGYVEWTNFSDGRYKLAVNENVIGLAFIMKLRPITYKLDINRLSADLKENLRRDKNGNIVEQIPESEIRSRNEKAQVTYTGFIGQEVENAARETGFDFSGVDAPKNENDFYGLRYSEFVVPLVKAVQEQQKIIEQLTKRIEELEKR